jgi:multidrug resistance efflux pump
MTRKLSLVGLPLVLLSGSIAVLCLSLLVPATQSPAQDDGAQDDRAKDGQQSARKPLRESGVVECASEVTIVNRAPDTVVIDVVPEGRRVNKGDLLLALDSSALEERLQEARIVVAISEAQIAQLKQQQAASKRRIEQARQAAQLQVQAAEAETAARLGAGGELEVELGELAGRIKIQQQRLEVVAQQLERQKRAGEEPALELELAAVEARESLAAAQARRDYVDKLKRKQVASAMELAHTVARLEAEQRLAEFEQQGVAQAASLDAAKLELEAAKDSATELEQQIAACRVTAPVEGVVLYANVYSSRGGPDFVVEQGASVRERQALLRICDLSKLRIRASVDEARVPELRVGQPAVVRIDALPDTVVRGKVSYVSPVAERTFRFGEDKRYVVHVALEEPPEATHIGLTATVEIDTEKE